MSIDNIIAIVFTTILFVALLIMLIILFIYGLKQISQEKEYLKTLNEHDKSVITDYQASKMVHIKDLFKRRKDK